MLTRKDCYVFISSFKDGFECPHCNSEHVVRFGKYNGRQMVGEPIKRMQKKKALSIIELNRKMVNTLLRAYIIFKTLMVSIPD